MPLNSPQGQSAQKAAFNIKVWIYVTDEDIFADFQSDAGLVHIFILNRKHELMRWTLTENLKLLCLHLEVSCNTAMVLVLETSITGVVSNWTSKKGSLVTEQICTVRNGLIKKIGK